MAAKALGGGGGGGIGLAYWVSCIVQSKLKFGVGSEALT